MTEEGRDRRRTSAAGVIVGRPLGIPIYVAPSWFLIAAVLTLAVATTIPDRFHLSAPSEYGVAAGFVVLLYGSVLVHELSHSIVARILGLPVRRIVLMLIGG